MKQITFADDKTLHLLINPFSDRSHPISSEAAQVRTLIREMKLSLIKKNH